MSSEVLRIENLHVSYGNIKALRGVSLAVKEGEVVGLVGRNGAGKSTTLKAIMRLLPIERGKIVFDERDITSLPPHQVPHLGIGYAPENRQIFSDLTVEDNIRMAWWQVRNREKFEEKLKLIIDVFPELQKLMSQRGDTLSGGEQKMVAIARALALNPKVLLLDEPFEGLAPLAVERLAKSIRRIAEKGISILVAESNIHNALKAIDRVYIIERGEIVGHETEPKRVFENKELTQVVLGVL